MTERDDRLFDELAVQARLPIALNAEPGIPDPQQRSVQDLRNQQLLAGMAVLDRTSIISEDASDAARDIARLDNKLDLVLLMLSERLQQLEAVPPIQQFTISASGFALSEEQNEVSTAVSRVILYPHPVFALPLTWWAEPQSSGRWRFLPGSVEFHDAMARWVFRHHRRQVAMSAATNLGGPT